MAIGMPRAYYLPIHLVFVWPALRPSLYPLHPVAWDNMCGVPFPGLCHLLAAFWERDHDAGAREIERLIDGYATQRMEALRARTLVVARMAARESNLDHLAELDFGHLQKKIVAKQGLDASSPLALNH